MRFLFVILLAVIVLGGLKIYVWDKSASSDGPTAPRELAGGGGSLPVSVYIADVVTAKNTIYASGTIVPNEEVALSSEVSGRLVMLDFREGDYIPKGHLIAKLDDSEIVAQLRKLTFEEELADQTEARQRRLLDIDAISKEEYDLAVNRVKTLSADRELLQVQQQRTELRAPFGGRVGFKNISEGAYLTPATVIGLLIQSDPVKIDFDIPEKYAPQVFVKQEITFEIDAVANRFVARVVAIDPKVDEDLRTLRVRAQTDNKLGLLKPGMFVRVTLPLDATPSIMIPTESILPVLKGKIVYTYREGRAVETPIETGLRTDREVQVLQGIAEGDSVIVSALMMLKPDLPVRVDRVVNELPSP